MVKFHLMKRSSYHLSLEVFTHHPYNAVQKGGEEHTDLVPPLTPSSEINKFSFCYLFVYVL